uniref:Uncharacterized protein n=1 Tax=Rhizophora mucronata TaxID=61149 RepID=A0A2P2QJH9_RHIMU
MAQLTACRNQQFSSWLLTLQIKSHTLLNYSVQQLKFLFIISGSISLMIIT